MSKAVMLSIQPKWCELIASGKKTIEVRKTRPKLETPFKVYIYCTLQGSNEFFKDTLGGDISKWNKGKWGNKKGKVIGEFICDKIEVLKRNEIFNAPALYSQSRLTREEYFNYIGNKTTYIWHIAEPKIYDEPKELSEFIRLCPEWEKEEITEKCIACNHYYRNYEECTASCECEGELHLTKAPQSWCYVEEISGA